MYLANNTRPDIAYATHQCARYTHAPKESHALAVKRIVRYLQGTSTKGLAISPSKDLMQIPALILPMFQGYEPLLLHYRRVLKMLLSRFFRIHVMHQL